MAWINLFTTAVSSRAAADGNKCKKHEHIYTKGIIIVPPVDEISATLYRLQCIMQDVVVQFHYRNRAYIVYGTICHINVYIFHI